MNRPEQAGVGEGAVGGGRAWRSEAEGGEAHASGLLRVAEEDCAVRFQGLPCVVANRTPTKANKTAGEGGPVLLKTALPKISGYRKVKDTKSTRKLDPKQMRFKTRSRLSYLPDLP